jgi:thioredoxin:protein disulfide reductase
MTLRFLFRMFAIAAVTLALPAAAATDTSVADQLKSAMSSGNVWLSLALVFAGGFLTSLSPCVYPLIPVTLSILGTRKAKSPMQGFWLAAVYVLGMVVLFTTLGVSFAALGVVAGSLLQSPVVTIGVALFCLAMAASMFGAFEFALPSSLQTKLSSVGGGGFGGAFVMGLVAGIIAAPCTGPVLSFILTLIARENNLPKGALLMVFYALGMGVPFLVLGTFSQAISRMPKSGNWMEVVKSIFGLLMIGAALYYLTLGIPALGRLTAPLSGAGSIAGPVLIAVGAVIGALHLSFKYTTLTEKIRKGVGVAVAVAGIVAFLSWANAGTTATSVAWRHIDHTTPGAVDQLDGWLAEAKSAKLPVMIDFGAAWCFACKELDKLTYVDGTVLAESQRFMNIKVDATEETAALTAIQSRFGIVGLPTVAFFAADGTRATDRVTGFLPAAEYVEVMRRVH